MVRRRFMFAGCLVVVFAILGGPAVGISWGQGNPYVLDGNNPNQTGVLQDSNGDFTDGSNVSSSNLLKIINGAPLDLNSYNLTIAGLFDDYPLSLDIPPLVGNSSTTTMSTLTIGGAGAQAAYYGTVGDPNIGANMAVVINGPVSQTFYGVNGYTGGTTIQNGGMLGIYSDASLGAAAGPLAFNNGGTLQAAGEGIVISSSRSITINGGTATFDTNGFNNMTVNSPIGGTGALAKIGTGMLTLTGTNTYSGGTNINQGAIAAGMSSLGSGAVVLSNGGKLSLTGGGQVFSGFSGMTLNGGAAVSGGTLTLTDGNGNEARSAFLTNPLAITNASGFSASFVYRDVNQNGADGATFCIQAQGPTALGGAGGSLGWSGLNNTGAVGFNLYSGNGGSGTAFFYSYSGGANGPNGAASYKQTTPLNIDSGDPILVNLTYNGGANTLSETLLDETTQQTFSTTYMGVNFQSLLAGQNGYVGFTGATGGVASTQTITNFQFADSATSQYPPIVVAANTSGELNYATASGTSTTVAAVTLNAASTLNITSSAAANSPYSISANTLTVAGAGILNVANNGSGLGTFTPSLVSGSGPLTKTGGGTLVLSNSDNSTNYSGQITIGDSAGGFGGTVAVAGSGALGSGGAVTINNGILDIQVGYSETAAITLNHANSTIQVDSGAYTPGLALAFGANGALTKTGLGTLALTNLTLPAGQNVTAAGGIIDFGGTTVNVTTLTVSGGSVNNGTVNVVSSIAAQSGAINAQLSGNGSLTKTTAGTVYLTSPSNNYAGGTTVQGGILQVSGSGQLPSGSTVNLAGGMLQLNPLVPGLLARFYQDGNAVANATGGGNLTPMTLSAYNAVLNALTPNATTSTAVNSNLTLNFPDQGGNETVGPFTSIGAGQFVDNYDVRMSGFMTVPTTGTYYFRTGSDDGSMVWLNGTEVVNNNAYQGVTWRGSGAIQLTAGTPYPITIEYYQGGGGQSLDVQYSTNDSTWVDLPNTMVGTAPATVSCNNSVHVTAAGSTIDVPAAGLASLNALTMDPGSGLTVSSNAVQFNSTSFTGAGAFTLNVTAPSLATGTFSDGGFAATVNVTGSGALVLNSAANSLPNTAFAVNGGKLMFVGGSGAMVSQGSAAVTLSGGATLQLASTDATAITYDLAAHNVTFVQNVNFIAGMDYAGEGGAVSGGMINLSNGGNGFNISAGNYLAFSANNNYTMNVGDPVAVTSGGTLTGAGTPGGKVYLSALNNAAGAVVAPIGGDFIIANQQTNGQFSPSGSGGVTFSGGFNGDISQLAPAAGGTIYLPTANTGMTVSSGTVNVTGGAWILASQFSLGAYPPGTTLELDGGTLGASAALTGTAAVANPLVFGPSQSINIAGSTTMVPTTSAITFTSPISLTNGAYTFDDPNGRSTFSGVLSGAGAVVIAPTGGNPNNNWNGTQTVQSPVFAGFNTYTGGTTIDSTLVRITNRQAFGTGTLNFNWGGIDALTNLTGELAVANNWTSTANEMWFRGANSIELSGNGAISGATTFRIPDGSTVTISGAVTGNGGFYRGGDGNGTLVLNNLGSTYTGSNGGNGNNGAVANYGFPNISFTKNDNGGNVVVDVGSMGGSGTNVTSGPFGVGSVEWANGSWLVNGTSQPLTIGNDILFDGYPMGLNGGAGLTLSGNMLIDSRDKQVGDIYTSGNVTFSGQLTSTTTIWNNGLNPFHLYEGSGGVVTLSGNNANLAGVIVSQGTLAAANNSALGPSSYTAQLGDGSTAGNNDGTLALVLSGPVTVANPISVNNYGKGTTLGGITNDSSAFTGAITLAKSVNIVSSATGGNAVTFNGVISDGGNGLGITAQGPGNVVFAAQNTYTGTTAINGGVLALDFSQATSPTNNIVSASSPLSFGGGTLAVLGNSAATNSQTFVNTTIAVGASDVALNPLNNGTTNLNLGTIARNAGATVDFNLVGSGAISTASGPSGQILTDGNGAAYATVGGSDWAAVSSGNIVGLSTIGGYTPTTASALAANANVAVAATTLAGNASITSLRFNVNQASTVNLNGNTLTTGGILVTPAVNTAGSNVSGGILQGAAGGDLVVIQNSSAPFTIDSTITDNGSATALTKSGSGALVLSGVNTYSGATYVNSGTLQGPVASLPTAVTVANNATLAIDDQGGNVTFGQSITGAGGLTKIGNGMLTLAGTVAMSYSGPTHITGGTLQISPPTLSLSSLPAGLLDAWFSASSLNLSNGASVATWPDLSGNGHNATLTQGTMTFVTNQINGQPDVQFRSATNPNEAQTYANLAGTMNVEETIAVFRQTGSDWGSVLGSQSRSGYLLNNGGGFWNQNMPLAVSQNGTSLASPYTISNIGSFSIVAIDGNLNDTTLRQYALNQQEGWDNNNMDLAEVLAFSSTLTQAETNLIGAYLAKKYDIASTYTGGPGFTSQSPIVINSGATFDISNSILSVASISGSSGSTIQLGSGGLTIGSDNTSTTFAGVISGVGGSLTKVGNGTMTLGAANTFSGATTISGGAILLADPNALQNSVVTVGVDNGLAFAVNSANLAGLGGTGAVVMADGASPMTLTVGSGNANTTYSGVLSDNGAGSSLVKTGSGLLAMSGRNTYSGATILNGGVYQANDGGGLPAASFLQVNDGTVLQSDGPADFTRTVGTAAGDVQWTGDVAFAANGGKLTVNLNGGSTLVWGATPYFLGQGNNLVFGSAMASAETELQNNIDLNGQQRTVIINSGVGGDFATLSGNIVDSAGGGSLYKTGAGLLKLSGNNTFTGGLTLNAGTVQLANAGALNSSNPNSVTFTANSTADLQLNGNSITIPVLAQNAANPGSPVIENVNSLLPATLTINGAGSFSGTIRDGANSASLSLAFNPGASNMYALTGVNSFSGTASISSGTLQGSSTSLTGPVALANSSTVQFNQTSYGAYAQSITGIGSLVKTGSGALLLQGANTYTGTTYVSGGTLQIGSPQAGLQEGWFGSVFDTTDPFSASVQQSVQLSPRAANWTGVINNTHNNGATLPTIQSGIWYDNSTVMYQGYMYIGAAAGNTVSFFEQFDDDKELVLNGSTLINNGAYSAPCTANWTVPASGPGWYPIQLRFGQGGGGAGPNSGYTIGFGYDPNGAGGTTQSNYTFLTDPGDASLFTTGNYVAGNPTSLPANPVVMASNTALDLSNTPVTIASLSDAAGGASGQTVLLGTSGALTVGGNNVSTTFSGVFSGSGSVTKVGNGALSLMGNNASFAGTTNISAGTVQAVNSIGTGLLNIGNATFRASGNFTLTGSVSVGNANSTVSVDAGQTLNLKGQVVGSGGLNKTGAGTLVVSNRSAYSGATLINQGTLQMAGGLAAAGLPANAALSGSVVDGYQDFFNSPTLNSAWQFATGTGVVGSNTSCSGDFNLVSNGSGGYCLHVTNAAGDPNHMLYMPAGMNASGNYTVLALVQPNISSGVDRGGICAAVSPNNNEGINELFGGNQGSDNVSSLYDMVAWGPQVASNYTAGQKYWMQLTISGGNSETIQFWPADGTTPQSSAATAAWTSASASGFAGITASSGGNIDMNVYYELIENSQLPSIAVGGSGMLPATSTVSIASGANWDLNGTQQTVAGLASAGNVINSNQSMPVTLTLSPTGGSSVFSGSINDNGSANSISLVVNGAGTQVLAGTSNYSGTTTVSSGTLAFASIANADGVTPSSLGMPSAANGTITLGSYSLSTTGTLQFVGNTSQSSNRTIQILNDNCAIDASGVNGAVLTLTGNGSNPAVDDSAGCNLVLSGSGKGVMSGAIIDNGGGAAVYKDGTGTWVLTNPNNAYSGSTNVNAGVLVAGVGGALPTTTDVTVSGGTLDAQLAAQTVNSLTMTGGALNLAIGNLFTASSTASLTGTLDVFGTSGTSEELMAFPGGYTGTFANTIIPSGFTLSYQANQLDLLLASVGPPTWQVGSGNWNLGANWTGGTVPNGAQSTAVVNKPVGNSTVAITLDTPVTLGTLQLGNSTGTGGYTISGNATDNLTFDNGTGTAVLSASDGAHTLATPITLNSSLSVSPSAGALIAISGNIGQGPGVTASLTLANSGELVLSGSDSYQGGTIVDSGKLVFTSSASVPASGALIVGAGGVMAFDPSVTAGAVELASSQQVVTAAPMGTAEVAAMAGTVHAAGGAVEAVPEPGTLALLLAAFGCAVACCRISMRRRS